MYRVDVYGLRLYGIGSMFVYWCLLGFNVVLSIKETYQGNYYKALNFLGGTLIVISLMKMK
jgi:hypothetical protein